MPHYFNIANIRKEIFAQKGAIDRAAVTLVKERFKEEKQAMLDKFQASDVTQEILQGADGDNITETLSAAKVPGNLFAFLGFDNGSENEVIQHLHDLIDNNTKLNTTSYRIQQSANIIRYRFVGETLTPQEIYQATPVNWGDTARGRSWVAIVENGTNAFTYYLYKRWEQGRSLEALQAKTKKGQLIIVNQGQFNSTPYTSQIIREFVESVGTSTY